MNKFDVFVSVLLRSEWRNKGKMNKNINKKTYSTVTSLCSKRNHVSWRGIELKTFRVEARCTTINLQVNKCKVIGHLTGWHDGCSGYCHRHYGKYITFLLFLPSFTSSIFKKNVKKKFINLLCKLSKRILMLATATLAYVPEAVRGGGSKTEWMRNKWTLNKWVNLNHQ